MREALHFSEDEDAVIVGSLDFYSEYIDDCPWPSVAHHQSPGVRGQPDRVPNEKDKVCSFFFFNYLFMSVLTAAELDQIDCYLHNILSTSSYRNWCLHQWRKDLFTVQHGTGGGRLHPTDWRGGTKTVNMPLKTKRILWLRRRTLTFSLCLLLVPQCLLGRILDTTRMCWPHPVTTPTSVEAKWVQSLPKVIKPALIHGLNLCSNCFCVNKKCGSKSEFWWVALTFFFNASVPFSPSVPCSSHNH